MEGWMFWVSLLISALIGGLIAFYLITIGPACIVLGIILLIIRNSRGTNQSRIPSWFPQSLMIVGAVIFLFWATLFVISWFVG